MDHPTEEWRNLFSGERALVDALLAHDFPGRDAIAEQVREAKERMRDVPVLQFRVGGHQEADVRFRVPVEAECSDVDGIAIPVLLFVSEGVVQEIEFYKDDGSPFVIPKAEDLRKFFIPTSITN